ncbi:MAG TPA: class II fumarate hydratase [Clostridia bacterium]|jgi:fumarate hydratase class II|nr:class II fumarate hydratase [Clostridia bacterium]HRU83825.1 class II fumarate hydratase [Eubacteriales bacterium]
MGRRIEKDSFGAVEIPEGRLWGIQTERSRRNFSIGGQRIPMEIIRAIALIKSAAAVVNCKAGKLPPDKCTAIVASAGEILSSDLKAEFPLVVWQTGSGTQTNMNVNEVIARLAEGKCKLHPNDDVNMSQSTNDVFPSAIHIAAVLECERTLIPALKGLAETAKSIEEKSAGIVKLGRTHLQDATPIKFSEEVSAWRAAVESGIQMLNDALKYLRKLALGGTAVGNGINAPQGFGKAAVHELNLMTSGGFVEDENKFRALSMKDAVSNFHGVLKTIAASLFKIANDVRWLASGPRGGIGEITIPANEAGSSIMPGKVNPTQSEALMMVAAEILGNDATVAFAASQGNFQLNVCMPVIAFKVMESIKLLADGVKSFDKNCFSGLVPNAKKMRENVEKSLMLATALAPHIGYDKASELVRYADKNNLSLGKANLILGLVAPELFQELIDRILR